jgi:hypothetical protein
LVELKKKKNENINGLARGSFLISSTSRVNFGCAILALYFQSIFVNQNFCQIQLLITTKSLPKLIVLTKNNIQTKSKRNEVVRKWTVEGDEFGEDEFGEDEFSEESSRDGEEGYGGHSSS